MKGTTQLIAMKKPEVHGPSPSEKAKRSLGAKLNRPSKPPPSPNELSLERKPLPARPIKGERTERE